MITDAPAALSDVAVDAEFRLIVDRLTRRGLLAGGIAAGAGAGLALAGCSTGDNRHTPSSKRTVTTTAGTFTVPAAPERVVCIDYFTAIFLIELGLTPTGGIDYSWVDTSSMYPAYVPILKKLPNIGEITSTDYEKITALRPDLILGPTPGSQYDNSKGAMKTLTAVAPVASVDFGSTGDWRGPFEQTAKLVNRTAELAPLIASYRRTVSETKTSYADLLATTVVSVVDYSQDGNYALDLPKSTDGVVLADLGVTFGKASADNGSNNRGLSLERISDLADSDIILYRADAKKEPTNGLQDVVKLRAWKELPAVKAGHVYPIGWADVCTYRWAENAIKDFTGILDTYGDNRRGR
ncbi:ABC transporter substrate-binding protein [Microlunatus endophyticus]|uniref:ABC transporter substrate-binding protein n=1 Tax=Microlunatus endophyticus TaxID=1716077 RepID=A0A917S6Q0_9ACTN|nr:ABC transporter substrate-binding protein [Microlunatus endophyticus]GGL59836.1 ABC transporter substrate-binding protein [Microlunatus endophyticus]